MGRRIRKRKRPPTIFLPYFSIRRSAKVHSSESLDIKIIWNNILLRSWSHDNSDWSQVKFGGQFNFQAPILSRENFSFLASLKSPALKTVTPKSGIYIRGQQSFRIFTKKKKKACPSHFSPHLCHPLQSNWKKLLISPYFNIFLWFLLISSQK